ncbi:MAG: Hsp70 family protein, partial [Gammaproteobacteria bacterium]|nr:Hsp70 family protein [Gammaproteobacteria bacterium]
NQADNMLHATKKSMEELGDKLDGGERASIEAAINDLEAVMDSDDKDKIEAKTKALTEASAKMAEKLYADQGAAAGAAPGAEAAGEQPSSAADDDVVDAEFEEVDDSDKKA